MEEEARTEEHSGFSAQRERAHEAVFCHIINLESIIYHHRSGGRIGFQMTPKFQDA